MSTLKLIDAPHGVTTTVTESVQYRDPFDEQPVIGVLTVVWTCAGSTVEPYSLSGFVASHRDTVTTAENLVAAIANGLSEHVPHIRDISVTAEFELPTFTLEVAIAVPGDTVHR